MLAFELVGGLVLLFAGGEFLVRGAVAAATRLGVSPLVIGLTLVGFGTSTPELVASIDAALIGAPGIAVGNIVGSNIANILLILGFGAVLRPIEIHREAFLRDGPVLLGVSVLLVVVCLAGAIGRIGGAALVTLLIGYTVLTYILEQRSDDAAAARHKEQAEAVPARPVSLPLAVAITLAGFGAVLAGAHFLVEGAVTLARLVGVSDAVIGLTVVAVGTSLPELATTIMAVVRRQGDVAFGNVVGSNIFNGLGILGATALVRPLEVPEQIARFDVWVMFAVALFAVWIAITGWRVTRIEGGVLLAGYVLYLGFLLVP